MGAFFIGLLISGVTHAACPLPGRLPVFAVERVVDGDTLRLADGRSVRLIGLNTPELAHQGRPEEPYAVKAQRRLAELLSANDDQVALQVGDPARDHYGRVLAHAYDRAGQSLETQLLSEGLGYQVAFAPVTQLVACQQAAEHSARQAKRGVWRQFQALRPEQLDSGGFALIQGRVIRVERNRGGLWLEMGDSLVLQVKAKLLTQFDIEKLNKLTGHTVEVRGWVVDRTRRGSLRSGQARWLLPVTAAVMLELVE